MIIAGNMNIDWLNESYAYIVKSSEVLYDRKSEFQRITVMDTEALGRTLLIDHIFNASERMEAFYHEPMAHLPLSMINQPRDVLIIGGGDFGVGRHVLKHPDVERVTLCELDPAVPRVCREFFSNWAAPCEQDPRFTLHIGDGVQYIKESKPERFDVVIIDSTDPFIKAPMLVSDDFYQAVLRAMKPQAVLIQIIADFFFFKDSWFELLPRVNQHFGDYSPVPVAIPLYGSGAWGLLLASKHQGGVRPEHFQEYHHKVPTVETLSPNMVKGFFDLPPYLKQDLKGYLKET